MMKLKTIKTFIEGLKKKKLEIKKKDQIEKKIYMIN